MKRKILLLSLPLLGLGLAYGQVQIDKQLQMIGITDANRQITGVGNPSAGDHAPNVNSIQSGTLVSGTSTNSGNDYSVNLTPAPAGYSIGMEVRFKASASNTAGVVTLNVNGLGPKTIKKEVNKDLSKDDILNGKMVSVIYDGTNFQVSGGGGGGSTDLDFTMSLSSSTAAIDLTSGLGSSSSPITITLAFVSGTTAGVGFNLTGLPSGFTYALTPGGCFPSCTASLTINTGSAFSGTYPLTLTASGGGATHSASITLSVTGNLTSVTPGSNGVTVNATNSSGGPTGQVQLLTIPSGITSITIEAWGAQGGNASGGRTGGLGARMKGTFTVTPGDILKIVVGQQGLNDGSAGGGGGGSFVATNSNVPLIVAGGGAGASSSWGNINGQSGLTSTSGGNSCSASGGAGGEGGGTPGGSPGGGGFNSDGTAACMTNGNGKSFLNAGYGGKSTGCGGGEFGGFGGGGNGDPCCQGAGGAGGGYSGGAGSGNCSPGAGGGGSFNNGSSQSNSAGVNSGNGKVIFTW